MSSNPLAFIQKHLALKILLPVAAIFLLASILGVVATGAMFNKYLERQLVERGLLVASTLKDAAKVFRSNETLQEFVVNLSNQNDIDFVIIASGSPLSVVACTDPTLVGKLVEILPKADFVNDLLAALESTEPSFEFDQGGGTLLDISAPIQLSGQTGALMVHLRTAPLKNALNSLKQQASEGFLVALAALLGFLLWLVNRWVLVPQRELLSAVTARNAGQKAYSQVSTQDEFLRLSNAFNEMVRTGDEVEIQKNRFVSTVSHELRTPLTSIKGGLSIFLSQRGQSLEPQYRGLLEIALRNASRLHAIINDLLDMEKINADQLELNKESVNLVELIEGAIQDCSDYAVSCKVHMSFKTDLPEAVAYVDNKRIQQVLLNLLSNAAKFSPEDGEVEVSLESQDSSFRISVQDYGCGIPESFRADIFKSFKQADNTSTRAKGGTGLGLAISNRLLALHGTTLEYTSSLNVGTRFFFDLAAPGTSVSATSK